LIDQPSERASKVRPQARDRALANEMPIGTRRPAHEIGAWTLAALATAHAAAVLFLHFVLRDDVLHCMAPVIPAPPRKPEFSFRQVFGRSSIQAQRTSAVFNLLPLPPLDGGRIAVGLLPKALAAPLAGLEPYGMIILIGVLFILPLIGAQMGLDLNVVSK
jgi:Zn-dependent protease